jgi:hypothetical protein
MKTHLIAAVLALSMVGCLMADDSADRLVQMPVEGILVSVSARVGAHLEVQFVGLLTNGCQRFERLEVIETERSAMVVMWARERKPPGVVCTADIREVQQARTFRPVVPGQFVISVKQPDGSLFTREVRVE